ncbi:unnamed protein product [Discula destructiva]
MRFSRSFKASPHCLPSPNGEHVATLTLFASPAASTITVRAIKSLRIITQLSLPRDFTGPVSSFQWSPSSEAVLVASAHEIHVFSAFDERCRATIRTPVPPAAKPVYVGFAASDANVCVCASLGLKFVVLDLTSSKAVEVVSPKFHTAATVRKGFCFRPETRHLALITRTSGKDMISIHHPRTKELQRSWAPDTIDAQGLLWSPDGKWLVTWESAAHGHKVLFYTPDGNLFKSWSGPQPVAAADADIPLGPGVRLVEFSADANSLAIADNSRRICIINMTSVSESLRLSHPTTIVSTGTLQVWQEQVSNLGHHFVKALQTLSPPNALPGANSPSPSGIAFMSFDPSSALLATKLEQAPSTLWIWDVPAAELRAVLIFHGTVSRISWHPAIRETLLITCEGEAYKSLVFLWDPLSKGPQTCNFSERLPHGNLQALWLNLPSLEPGALFVSDNKDYLLVSLAEDDDDPVPWSMNGEDGESEGMTDHSMSPDLYDQEASQLDDTFHFRRT